MLMYVLVCALAVSFGWGVRGTIVGGPGGAMVAGALMGLGLALVPGVDGAVQSSALQLSAVGALGLAFGGKMTYGQTLGLTHDSDPPPAYWWGILGTAVKGSPWIGLGALLLGMNSSYIWYAPKDWVLVVGMIAVLWVAGILLLNRPLEPPRRFPHLYFSRRDATGRSESWGGMWLVFVALWFFTLSRGDLFASSLALFGLLGGLGFPMGQVIQSWGRRHRPLGAFGERWIDWWKVMEFTFGACAGLAVCLGWLVLAERFGFRPGRYPLEAGVGFMGYGVGIWLLLFFAYELRMRHGEGALPSIVHILVFLLLPLWGVAGGEEVWSYLVAGPFLFWISARKMLYGDGSPRVRLPALLMFLLAAMWFAFWLVRGGHPVLFWNMIIIYHLAFVILKMCSERGEELREWRDGGGDARGLVHALGPTACVLAVFLLQAVVLSILGTVIFT